MKTRRMVISDMAVHMNLSYKDFKKEFGETSRYKRLYLGCLLAKFEDDEGAYRFYDDKYMIIHYIFTHGILNKFCMVVGYDGTEYVCIDYFPMSAINDEIDKYAEFKGPQSYFITENPKGDALSFEQYYENFSYMPPLGIMDLKKVDRGQFQAMLTEWFQKTEKYQSK